MTNPNALTLRARLQQNRARWSFYAAAAVVAVLALWLALRPQAVEVETSAVVAGPMQVTIDNHGQVRVHDRYVIAAPVAGELERLELHDGDHVRKGQRVAVLLAPPLDARQREEAAARLESTRALARAAGLAIQRVAADQKLAANELARTEKLVAQGFLSPQAAEQARNADATTRAELRAAKAREQAALADVKAVQATLAPAGTTAAARRIELVAAVDGQVLRVHEKSARTVAAGTPLVTLGDPARYEVIVDVLSADAVQVRPGAPMLLEQWGGGKSLRATVRTIEPAAFTKVSALGIEEQRVNILGDPLDALDALGDGYRVEVRIVVWSAADAIIVPASSLFRVGEAWHLFVVEDGRIRETRVTVGRRNTTQAQITGGVAPGMQVVRFPGNALADGMRVVARAARS